MIDEQSLTRLQNEAELAKMVEAGKLIALPINEAIIVSPSLPANRRYVLPRVVAFLGELSTSYYATFHVPLSVQSAVRPVTVQKRLRRTNRNAAPETGEAASSHEAGCTIDIARRRLSRRQLRWLEWRLTYYEFARQATIVEEESNCLHIMISREI